MRPPQLAIGESTWEELGRLSAASVADGWAAPGVFATAVGPRYQPGSPDALLYVGKSGGPLIDAVGLSRDQAASSAASTRWMIERRNPSAFWVFADLVSQRESMAWSNLAKIDAIGASPPSNRRWTSIQNGCMRALADEIENLAPRKIVFTTHGYQDESVEAVLRDLGFERQPQRVELDKTSIFADSAGRLAVITRHPQGWKCAQRDPVARFIREWPRSSSCAA